MFLICGYSAESNEMEKQSSDCDSNSNATSHGMTAEVNIVKELALFGLLKSGDIWLSKVNKSGT